MIRQLVMVPWQSLNPPAYLPPELSLTTQQLMSPEQAYNPPPRSLASFPLIVHP